MSAGDDVAPPAVGEPLAVVAEQDGRTAAFGTITWWDESDGTRLYRLAGAVARDLRRQGIGRRLLAHQERMAADHWHQDPTAGTAITGANADETRPDRLALLRDAGYRVRFTLVDLARSTGGAEDHPLPEGLELRPVETNHHPRIHEAILTCFDRHGLGFIQQSYADFETRDTDLWLVAWDKSDDTIAALVTNERRNDGTADTPWVAVLPRWRRRGVAQALLRRNLHMLAVNGIQQATIRTTQENPDHTVELYEKVGYRVTARHPRFGKPITSAP